ncbi:protein of unknown function [Candidatus Filomicrobium marinum]|uniref:Uncharacterized protein n=1 Tax=Candidatus Filomicrobium marinum TaxID=1608628 RepID=A0A0D6JK11_9HYPH|nr:protein of unknown function [Candidatus Filomicrobium marinum]CPR22022.1 protein of unknown function [Candidatus Filomicrobium marinum]
MRAGQCCLNLRLRDSPEPHDPLIGLAILIASYLRHLMPEVYESVSVESKRPLMQCGSHDIHHFNRLSSSAMPRPHMQNEYMFTPHLRPGAPVPLNRWAERDVRKLGFARHVIENLVRPEPRRKSRVTRQGGVNSLLQCPSSTRH